MGCGIANIKLEPPREIWDVLGFLDWSCMPVIPTPPRFIRGTSPARPHSVNALLASMRWPPIGFWGQVIRLLHMADKVHQGPNKLYPSAPFPGISFCEAPRPNSNGAQLEEGGPPNSPTELHGLGCKLTTILQRRKQAAQRRPATRHIGYLARCAGSGHLVQ
jgi:hypothetical protein